MTGLGRLFTFVPAAYYSSCERLLSKYTGGGTTLSRHRRKLGADLRGEHQNSRSGRSECGIHILPGAPGANRIAAAGGIVALAYAPGQEATFDELLPLRTLIFQRIVGLVRNTRSEQYFGETFPPTCILDGKHA